MSQAFYDILHNNVSPTTPVGNSDITVGLRFKSSKACDIYGIQFFNAGGLNSNVDIAIYDIFGTMLSGPYSFGLSAGAGWFPLYFISGPYSIAANTEYVIAATIQNDQIFANSITLPYSVGPFTATFSGQENNFGNGIQYPLHFISTSATYGVDVISNYLYISDIADTNTLSDAVSIRVIIPQSSADSYSLSDTQTLSYVLLPSDTISLTEKLNGNYSSVLSDSNTLSWNDAIAFNLGVDIFVIISDAVSLADSTSCLSRGFLLVTNNQLSLSDNYDGFLPGIPLSISDSIIFSDQLGSIFPVFTDTINLIDFITLTTGYPFRINLDTVIISDSVQVSSTALLRSSDSNTLTDLINYTLPNRAPVDNYSLLDGAVYTLSSIFVDVTYTVSDSIQLFDSRQLSGLGLNPKLGDSFSLLDAVYPLLNSVESNYLRNYLNDSI